MSPARNTEKHMSKRRSLFALVSVLLTTLAVATVAVPAQAAGFSRMNIWNSTHCLDNATEDDTKLQMWNCGSGSEQKWNKIYNSDYGVYMLSNQHTGRCMTAPLWMPGTATMVECDTADWTQQWYIYHVEDTWAGRYYVWQNAGNGYCLSTPSVANGTLVQTIECDPYHRYFQWVMQ